MVYANISPSVRAAAEQGHCGTRAFRMLCYEKLKRVPPEEVTTLEQFQTWVAEAIPDTASPKAKATAAAPAPAAGAAPDAYDGYMSFYFEGRLYRVPNDIVVDLSVSRVSRERVMVVDASEYLQYANGGAINLVAPLSDLLSSINYEDAAFPDTLDPALLQETVADEIEDRLDAMADDDDIIGVRYDHNIDWETAELHDEQLDADGNPIRFEYPAEQRESIMANIRRAIAPFAVPNETEVAV